MVTRHDIKNLLAELSHSDQLHARAELLKPVAVLAEEIGQFQKPYDYLRDVEVCFDPEIRFLLNYAVRGDNEALQAREEFAATERNRLLGLPDNSQTTYVDSFMDAHRAEWTEFAERWLSSAFGPVYSRVPWNFDAQLAKTIATHLGKFGFRPLSRSFKTDVLGYPLVIKTDKGTWRPTTYLFLSLPTFGAQFPIGTPFFFSQPSLPKSPSADAILESFFLELARIFPTLLECLERGSKSGEDLVLRFGAPGKSSQRIRRGP